MYSVKRKIKQVGSKVTMSTTFVNLMNRKVE